MKKKLNLVLRNPVKLHTSNQDIQELPSVFDKIVETEVPKLEEKQAGQIPEKVENREKKENSKPEIKTKIEKKPEIVQKAEIVDLRKDMSLRIKQVWEFFCQKANADNELRNSFTVTRAEVMREAGIGSTNTYRDALKKMESLNLIKIELRPGVIAGSIFYLTENGLEQAKLVLEESQSQI